MRSLAACERCGVFRLFSLTSFLSRWERRPDTARPWRRSSRSDAGMEPGVTPPEHGHKKSSRPGGAQERTWANTSAAPAGADVIGEADEPGVLPPATIPQASGLEAGACQPVRPALHLRH